MINQVLDNGIYPDKLNIANGVPYIQYGFRTNHSNEQATLELTDRIISAMDNNEAPIGIFLDLSKTFDIIDHAIILYKLVHYGVEGISLQLLNNYLTNR